MPVKPIPDGYHTVTPYIIVKNASKAIDFYKTAFGATELLRLDDPKNSKIGHAEIKIGDSILMLADEFPEMNIIGPETLGGVSASMLIYVTDVDAAYAKALKAGGKELRPLKDQFYGDRTATLQDPFGHQWTLATHIEDVPPAEIQIRFEAMTEE